MTAHSMLLCTIDRIRFDCNEDARGIRDLRLTARVVVRARARALAPFASLSTKLYTELNLLHSPLPPIALTLIAFLATWSRIGMIR